MPMNASYITVITNAGRSAITHIGLVDGSGVEVSAARLPVTWTAESGGLIRPTADLTFTVGASKTVAGWRGFTALTGGTNHGGPTLPDEVYGVNGGQYVLTASATFIDHDAV
jgi:hypothetical protein